MALKDITGSYLSDTRLAGYLQSEQIRLRWCDLAHPFYGFYSWIPRRPPYIGLAERLKSDPARLRATLWEELGHHFTAGQELRRRPFVLFSLEGRDNDAVLENQALRWASLHLLTETEIRWWLEDGGGTLEHLAQRFNITEEMARERLNALQAHNPSLWQKILDRLEGGEARTWVEDLPGPAYRLIG